jgi:hypothetical protein
MLSFLKVGMRKVVLPSLVLVALNSFASLIRFDAAQEFWLFKNTRNWIEMVAVLTFTEAVICLLVAGFSGIGVSEHQTVLQQTNTGSPVDMKQYEAHRERSMSIGFRLAAIGATLILLTLILHFIS